MDIIMAEAIQFDVFLSYNCEDKSFVETLAKRLEDEAGLRVWLDKWHLIPGAPWQEGIEDALDQCRTYAVFLGPSGLGPWHNEEMRLALNSRVFDKKRRVIPVLLPGSNPDNLAELPHFLHQLTWVDFRGGSDDQDAFHRIVAGIKGISPGRNDDSSAERMAPPISSVCAECQRVQIYLQGNFSLLTADRRSSIQDALAGMLRISPEDIDVYRVYEGSVVFDLGIPPNATQRLRSLLQTNSDQLHLLKVDKVILEKESGGIEEWIIKEGKFTLVTSILKPRRARALDLANRFLAQGRWAEAEAAYEKAIRDDDLLFLSLAAKTSRPVEGPGTTGLFSGSAYARARLGRYEAAIERLEAGSTHVFSRTLAADLAHLNRADPVDRRAFEMALERWYNLDTEARHEIDKARKVLDAAIARIRTSVPEFLAASSLPFSDIAAAAAATDIPVIYLTTTPQGSLALIVLPDRTDLDDTQLVWLDDFTTTDLDHLLFERDVDGHVTGGYLPARSAGTAALGPILETMLNVLGQQLIGPLAHCLRGLGLERVVFVPFGQLSAMPLHAARYEGEDGPCYFLDEFEVTYAPGAWTLTRARGTHSKAVKNKFLSSGSAVGAFVQDEAEAVAYIAAKSPSAPAEIFYKPAIPPQLLLDQASVSQYLHLAYSIIVDVNDPLESVVMLAEGATLKLADLLSAAHLEGAQLVTLSAVKPALLDFYHLPEAGEAFPASFLEAGVTNVVGNLWQVNDLSASLLIKQFYTYYFRGGIAPSAALRRVQRWLREEVTAGAAAEVCHRRVESLYTQRAPALAQAIDDWTYYDRLPPDSHPFAHPVYWAAFVISGA
jgi:CHAT domain-containing protein/tetratricopeptide (TPR) repeat protein